MADEVSESFAWHEVRFQCPQCGRFVAESAVHSTDHRDDSTYYGVSTDWHLNCAKCGRVEAEPSIALIREHVEVDDV